MMNICYWCFLIFWLPGELKTEPKNWSKLMDWSADGASLQVLIPLRYRAVFFYNVLSFD
jgi:hypothetical protein